MKKEVESKSLIQVSTIILFIAYLALFTIFYYILSKTVEGKSFGFTQFGVAIVLTIIATFLLAWIRESMYHNLYLGLIAGIIAIVFAITSLYTVFTGPKTLVFAIIGTVITIIYLGWSFIVARNNR